jgi:hypothetical protein
MNCSLLAEACRVCFPTPPLPSQRDALSHTALQVQLSRYELWLRESWESKIYYILFLLPPLLVLSLHTLPYVLNLFNRSPSLGSKWWKQVCRYDADLFCGTLLIFAFWTDYTTQFLITQTHAREIKNMELCQATIVDRSPELVGLLNIGSLDLSDVRQCTAHLTSWLWAPLGSQLLLLMTQLLRAYCVFWCLLLAYRRLFWHEVWFRLFLSTRAQLFDFLPLVSWCVFVGCSFHLLSTIHDISLINDSFTGCTRWVIEYLVSNERKFKDSDIKLGCEERLSLSPSGTLKLMMHSGFWIAFVLFASMAATALLIRGWDKVGVYNYLKRRFKEAKPVFVKDCLLLGFASATCRGDDRNLVHEIQKFLR